MKTNHGYPEQNITNKKYNKNKKKQKSTQNPGK